MLQSSLGADSKTRLNKWGLESHYSRKALFASYFSSSKISQFEKSVKCWIFKYIGIYLDVNRVEKMNSVEYKSSYAKFLLAFHTFNVVFGWYLF